MGEGGDDRGRVLILIGLLLLYSWSLIDHCMNTCAGSMGSERQYNGRV